MYLSAPVIYLATFEQNSQKSFTIQIQNARVNQHFHPLIAFAGDVYVCAFLCVAMRVAHCATITTLHHYIHRWFPSSRLLPHHHHYRDITTTTTTSTMASTTIKVCANLTTMFPERGPLASRYAAAKRAGFKAVETSLPYRESAEILAKELQENQLTQVLINSDPGHIEGGEMGFACIPGQEAIFKDSLDKTLTYAKALNCGMVHIMVGLQDKKHTEEEHMQTLQKNLQYAADLFRKENIVGVVEPKNNITFPGYFLNDFDKAVSLLFKINSPHLRLLLDFFHLQHICGNITQNIDRLLPYTAHVQVSQPPQRSEPDTPGELDFVYIINKLKSAGYTGYIGAEYFPSTKKTEDSLGWIKKCGLTF